MGSCWRWDMRSYVHGFGRGSPWIWWTCDLRYMVCEGVHPGDCDHVTPGTGSELGCQPGNSGHVTPGAGSGRKSTWRFWTCDSRNSVWGCVSPYRQWKCYPRCRFGRGVTLKTEHVTQGAWSARCGLPGDSGHVTPGKGSWKWGHPGECGHVTLGAGSGRDLPW